jgi:hypothetical protein
LRAFDGLREHRLGGAEVELRRTSRRFSSESAANFVACATLVLLISAICSVGLYMSIPLLSEVRWTV